MRPALAAFLLSTACSWAAHAKSVVHETAPSQLPSDWTYAGPAADSESLSLSVALKQPGLQELRARLDDISNPSHKDYGQHVSRDLLSRYQAVPDLAVEQVVSWLEEYDVSEIKVDGTWVRFNATVGQVEELLVCKMSKYYRDGSSTAVYRAQQYGLPEKLLGSIDYVYPVTQFMNRNQNKRSSVVSHSVGRRSESSISPRAGT